MSDIISTETIIGYLKEAVEEHKPLAPSVWIDAAQKLNVLLGDEHDKLFRLQQIVAQMRLQFLDEDEKRNVSAAKARIEAKDEYRQMREQEAKCKRIEEFIRISKVQARLREAEMRGY